MADLFSLESGLTEGGVRSGSGLSTGDLRRKYNFGSRVSELNIAQDPFFRMISKLSLNAYPLVPMILLQNHLILEI